MAFPCRCQVEKLRKDVDVLRRYSIWSAWRGSPGRHPAAGDFGAGPRTRDASQRHLRPLAVFAENRPAGWCSRAQRQRQDPPGCGVANLCIENGQTVYYIMAADLLDHLRSTHAPDSDVAYDTLFEQVRNVPL